MVVKDIAIGAVGVGFDSRAGQMGNSVVKGSPCVVQALCRGDKAPPLVTRFGVIARV